MRYLFGSYIILRTCYIIHTLQAGPASLKDKSLGIEWQLKLQYLQYHSFGRFLQDQQAFGTYFLEDLYKKYGMYPLQNGG